VIGLALMVALAQGAAPTDHTLVYYNARMALREGRSREAVQLWLLRNALEDQTGHVSAHDADFHSITWAALGDLGICQDGHALDNEGVGLWPLALHNWVVRNMGRRQKQKRPRPFDAFGVGRQQRIVAINDVLSAGELEAVQLYRGSCLRPRLALLDAGELVTADFSDRQVVARLMLHLLDQARSTLADDRVRGLAAIEARRFDLHLQLASLGEREARREARELALEARQLGLGRGSVAAIGEEAPKTTLELDSESARIVRQSVQWSTTEWMSLSPERRRFLFDHALAFTGDQEALDGVALGIVDALILEGDGAEVEKWVARVGSARDPSSRAPIWSGDRGQGLLALDRESGFRERGVIALHRGVSHLETGELPEALRAMAYALQHAPESRDSEAVAGLSRRWLSYVAGQFELSDDLLVTLQVLVPRRDYAVLLEDLMWRAAFLADAESFERGLRNQLGRGALERRLSLLQPLATGDVGLFATGIRDGLRDGPSETMRFLDQLVQRIEREDGDVRAAHALTLTRVRALLAPLAEAGKQGGRQGRAAARLSARTQAILEGLGALGDDAGMRDRARSMAPGSEVFAGSLRLAPSDPLPWPFRATTPGAPSVFTPLELTPLEWRDADDVLVFGWGIGG